MDDKEETFTSRANLTIYKNKIKSATNGLVLIKRKRDALDLHVRGLEERLKVLKPQIDEMMLPAIMTLIHGRTFLGTDLQPVLICGDDVASAVCYIGKSKVMGTSIETIQLKMSTSNNLDLIGLGTGGSKVQEAREKFVDILGLLIETGSIQLAIILLEKARKDISTRVSAIEYVIIPRLKNTYRYIENELEERDREEFFRMKRSKECRQKESKDKDKGKSDKADLSKVAPYQLLCSCSSKPSDADRIAKERAELAKIPPYELLCGCTSKQPANFQPKISKMVDQGKRAKDKRDTFSNETNIPNIRKTLGEEKRDTYRVQWAVPEEQENLISTSRRAKKRINKTPQEKSMQTDDDF